MKKYIESDIPDSRQYAGKIKRLAIALIKHGYTFDDAVAFISSAKGITDEKKTEIAIWFAENLKKLENRDDYKEICEDCACCLGGKRYAAAREIFKSTDSLAERIDKLLRTPVVIGYAGKKIDENSFEVYFYPQQEYYRCPCLRFDEGKQPVAMPEGYCYCCAGHLKHHIEGALGRKVKVTMKASSLTSFGKEGCRFLVEII